jgi:hypothetical protein
MTNPDRPKGEPRPGPGSDRRKPAKFSFGWVLLALLAVLLASQFLTQKPKRPTWNDLSQWAEKGELKDVVITPSRITGRHLVSAKGEQASYEPFDFPRVEKDADVEALKKKLDGNYSTEEDSDGIWTVLTWGSGSSS